MKSLRSIIPFLILALILGVSCTEKGEQDIEAEEPAVEEVTEEAQVLLDEAATEAVVTAEAAIVDLSTKALVDTATGLYNTANNLVTALPEGTVKDDLTARLAVVQDAIEDTTIEGKIAFVSDCDGNDEIYIMNIDGSGQTNLTNNQADEWNPFFSPDGNKIVFVSDRDGKMEIYIMNIDGSEQTKLTDEVYNTNPCFPS